MFRQRLTVVRIAHDAVYVVMSIATLAVLYAGLTGAQGRWLGLALALIVIEIAVFAGFGMRCPLAIIARRYGAETGHAFEAWLSPRMSRVAFVAVDSVAAFGIALLAARWTGIIG